MPRSRSGRGAAGASVLLRSIALAVTCASRCCRPRSGRNCRRRQRSTSWQKSRSSKAETPGRRSHSCTLGRIGSLSISFGRSGRSTASRNDTQAPEMRRGGCASAWRRRSRGDADRPSFSCPPPARSDDRSAAGSPECAPCLPDAALAAEPVGWRGQHAIFRCDPAPPLAAHQEGTPGIDRSGEQPRGRRTDQELPPRGGEPASWRSADSSGARSDGGCRTNSFLEGRRIATVIRRKPESRVERARRMGRPRFPRGDDMLHERPCLATLSELTERRTARFFGRVVRISRLGVPVGRARVRGCRHKPVAASSATSCRPRGDRLLSHPTPPRQVPTKAAQAVVDGMMQPPSRARRSGRRSRRGRPRGPIEEALGRRPRLCPASAAPASSCAEARAGARATASAALRTQALGVMVGSRQSREQGDRMPRDTASASPRSAIIQARLSA